MKILLITLLLGASLYASSQTAPIQYARKINIEKAPCGFEPVFSDTTFTINSQPYELKYQIVCSGEYSVWGVRTVNSEKKVSVMSHQNQEVRILLTGKTTKEILIKKDQFSNDLKPLDLSKMILGTTTIDKIDKDNKTIHFSTFIGRPDSDDGLLLKYRVGLDGSVTFMEKAEVNWGE